MALNPTIVARRALRGLAERPLDSAVVRRLFEAAALAPSAANKQPWRFVAIQDPAFLEKVRATFSEGNYWAKKAPLIVAAWTHLDYDIRTPDGRDFALYDLGQAVFALQVQAAHEGLITHPFAGFDAPRASTLLGLPEGAILPALISVSFAGSAEHLSEKHREGETLPRTRKPIDEIVTFR
jgi:nitroreductase